MISPFRHSLRRKLILLLTVVATISVVSSCMGLFAYQWQRSLQALYKDSATQARLVASNSGEALLFNDAKAANETLGSLHGDPRVNQACLYSRTGNVVGMFQGTNQQKACPVERDAKSVFHVRTLHIRQPVVAGGEAVETLFLDISLAEIRRMLVQFLKVGALTACISVVFALFLSSLMERWISRPILQLTEVAVLVSKEGSYALRATCETQDEVGLLINHFNQMLARIQRRDFELRSSYDLLEQKVEERTRDLTTEIKERKVIERDLERAKDTAEQSNQAKSSFLANMSHELRTPLNAIIGYSEMLFEDTDAAGQTEMADDLKKVLSSAQHLREIINDVLDLSKIEAGQMSLFMEQTQANLLLNDVVATAEVLSRLNGNTLVIVPLGEDIEVSVDPLRFRQSLLNLVSNACKFTAFGTVTMSARIDVGPDCRSVVWSVQDTGPGIAEADRNKLFKNFSQVDSSATRKHGGTGLGLSISQELCKAMGGFITVQSTIGLGSTFSIHMPHSRSTDSATHDVSLCETVVAA